MLSIIPLLLGSVLVYLGRAWVQFRVPVTAGRGWTATGEVALAGVPALLGIYGPGWPGILWMIVGLVCFLTAFVVERRVRQTLLDVSRQVITVEDPSLEGDDPVDNAIAEVRSRILVHADRNPKFAELCRSAGVDV